MSSDPLPAGMAGKYLGVFRQQSASKKYFIKKFDERAHIYHNWWKDGQQWDYIDPITQSDLGPTNSATPKTNRIETYAEVTMSIDTKNGDCLGFFENEGNNMTAEINELVLVAFDTVPGTRSIAQKLYASDIKKILGLIYGATGETTEDYDTEVIGLAQEIFDVLKETTYDAGQSNINAFTDTMEALKGRTAGDIPYATIREALSDPSNIEVEAMYNQSHVFAYETDKFLTYLADAAFDGMTVDEAQRIKLVTYYTFKSIPLQSNWKIIISYRIYGN
jgi:hypothetical protein